MNKEQQLQKAHNDLERAEDKIKILKRNIETRYKVQDILVAAGFFTREKIEEAEAIMFDLES